MAVLQPSHFVHLHNHTHYSLLDGLQKIEPMIARVKALGMESVAITDHGSLSGVIEFYKAAKKEGIRPIIGIETYVAPRKHTDKDAQKDKKPYHLILLAMNNQGYKNLMKLASIAQLDGYYYKPRIDRELLEKYNEGLIVLSACVGGEVGEALRFDRYDDAKRAALWYKKVFGDRYYLELQDHGYQWEVQEKVNEKLLKLSGETEIPAVMTADAHYTSHEDQEAHEVLLCVQTGSVFDDPKRMSLTDTDLFLTDPRQIIERWGSNPELIQNTEAIAKRCSVTLDLGGILIPTFETPGGLSEKDYLEKMVWKGLLWRYDEEEFDYQTELGLIATADAKATRKLLDFSIEDAKKRLDQKVVERAEYEFGILDQMGFNGYFLIVADFINWGKGQGIVFGPGRGSAAGSILAYAISITELDPLEYGLLFERFLNPDRISMPDIDIDIQDSRRDEVIQYCVEKYGQEQVAHIVTFGTMAARNAIRDVARVLEVPYAEADRMAKLVPPPIQGRHIPLSKSIVDDPDLKAEYESSDQSKRVIDLAVRMEGTIRSHGVHAAGVVIAPDNIVNYAPLERAQKGVITTQYAGGPVEEIGLLKMDFLGLSNLTIINNAIRIIKRVYDVEIVPAKIPLDNQETFDLFCRGETTGVFQLESSGMKRYLRELKPQVFEDIVAMVSLYRPGPLTAGLTQKFIDRKNGVEKVVYAHESMKPALKTTYGVLVYQEQVMQIAKDMAGFTGGESDTLRKAVAKKKRDVLAKMKRLFFEGAATHSGVDEKIVQTFWTELEGFADYAFNKSHAACYGLIAYWTAYLKAHYPAAFMAALMTSDYDNIDRLYIEISESRSQGIAVLAPDVNTSFLEFAVVPPEQGKKVTQIRYGLLATKNVGTGVVEEIIKQRETDGPFVSIEDFASRVSPRTVNRKAWESLAKTGAFDTLEPNRAKILMNLDTILGFSQKLHKERASGQTDIFGGAITPEIQAKLELPDAPYVSQKEQLQWERELLGIYLSHHPLDDFEVYLEEQCVAISDVKPDHDGRKIQIGGVITTIREINTKKGAKMAFIGLADKTGETELIVFPGVYEETRELWKSDMVVVLKGSVNSKDRDGRDTDEVKIMVDKAAELTDATAKMYEANGKKKKAPKATNKKKTKTVNQTVNESPQQAAEKILYVHVTEPDDHEKLKQLKQCISASPGKVPVIVVVDRVSRQAIRLPERVEVTEEFLKNVRTLYGDSAAVLQ